jgi:uncharacterized protein (TIGR02118 family)
MIRITALYPKTSDSRFDMDYYLNTHTPLVRRLASEAGLTRIEVDEVMGGAGPDEPPQFAVICTLTFETLEGFQAGLASHGEAIMGDIPNFSNVQPIIQVSRVVAV